jgi:hypothetical protein
MTLGSLDLRAIDIADDGTYALSVGPDPAAGRANHVQTAPGAMYLFIRECRSDWRQIPSALGVRRLDPPRCDPWTDEQIAIRAGQLMAEDVPPMYWWMRILAACEPNTVPPPFGTGGLGGLVTQQVCFARLNLADDEAFVFTMGSGDAAYRNLTLYDFWFRTIDYPNRTSSFTNSQTIPNADGTTTYVVSHADPGVHNWLDSGGLHELLVVHRWQGLPPQPGPDGPVSAAGELVKVRDLDSVLPAGIARVGADQRREQLSERLATFLLRFRTD